MSSYKNHIFKLVLAAMFLALAMLLPFLTGQIPEIGNMLCPMHIPVLLCGFICGPLYGITVGAISPLLRFALFGMPVLMPVGVAMCFELATYGLVAGVLYKALPPKPLFIYGSLITSMLAGRLVWGAARVLLLGVAKIPFGWGAFISGALLTAIPGIILHIALIPPVVMIIRKAYPTLG